MRMQVVQSKEAFFCDTCHLSLVEYGFNEDIGQCTTLNP
jgi:hypothetical protein